MNQLENMLMALSDPDVFAKVWNQIRKDYQVEASQLELFASTKIDPASLRDDSIIMNDSRYECMIIIASHSSEALEKAYQQFCKHEKEKRNKEVLAGVLLISGL